MLKQIEADQTENLLVLNAHISFGFKDKEEFESTFKESESVSP